MRRARKNQQGEPSPGRKEYSRKSWSPGRRQRLPQPQRSGAPTRQETGRGARRRAVGPLGQPRGAGRGARGRVSRNEGIKATVVNWRTLRSQAIPPEKGGTGPPQPSEKGHSGPRAEATVPRVGEASHLGSGAGGAARSSVPCSLLLGPIPAPSPQPAGGATGQQREPVSPFITSRLRRQR